MEFLGVTLTFWNCMAAWVTIVTTYIIFGWLQTMHWRRKYNHTGSLPLPIIGTLYKMFTKKYTVGESERDLFDEYGPVSVAHFGAINCIHVADIDLLKKIFIKEHLQFQNRYSIDGVEPSPLDSMLLVLRDEDWKRARNVATPAFSSGKIKLMTTEINFCAGLLAKSFLEKAASTDPVDANHHFGCFTMDSIAGTTFGVRPESYSNPDTPFVHHASTVFGGSAFSNPILFIAFFFPNFSKFLTRFFGASFFYPLKSIQFFTDVIVNIIEERRASETFFADVIVNIIEERRVSQTMDRPDMIGLLMNAEDGENKKLSRNELVAMGFLAFTAGYHTTGMLLTFVSYVLATHPDIQEKLLQEIDDKYTDDDVTVKYEDIQELPYLDQVILETLRMYPPILRMNRTTSHDKDVQLDGVWFPAKTMIQYSMWQVHHDLGLYPEPDKFKPERFSPEERQKRDPFTFMPFGHGPRNCIGMRLALLEAKIAIIHTLKKATFVRHAQTEEPPELANEPFLRPYRPILIGVEARKLQE